MLKVIQVLWPSFLVAGVAEVIFFTVINPQELYLFGAPVHFSGVATYSSASSGSGWSVPHRVCLRCSFSVRRMKSTGWKPD